MTITAKNVSAKLFVAFVAAAMLFTLAAPSAKAATTEELQAQITALMAQIAALSSSPSTGAGAAACTFTRALTLGSEGSDVNCLQNYLTSAGHYKFSGGSTGYFGPVTASAVAAWQGANGVTPAVGYFGPVSQAKYAALMAATPATPGDDSSDDDATSGDLSGEASLTSFETNDGDDSDDVEEGSSELAVADFNVEFSDGDAMITRLDIALVGANTPTEADPWKVFGDVSLMVDGDSVATIDASDKDNYLDEDDGTLRFTGLDIVAMEDEEITISVAVDVASNVDDSGTDADWEVNAEAIRFVDADDVTTTDTETGDLDGVVVAEFSIDEAGAGDDLNLESSDSDPDATTFELDEDANSEEAIFAFDLSADDSDGDVELSNLITINVTVATTAASVGDDMDNLVNDYRLEIDGQSFSAESYTGTGLTAAIDFDIDGDVTIDADSTVTAVLYADFENMDTVDQGSTIFASVATADIDAEGSASGESVSIDGSTQTGETHTLRTEGVAVTYSDDTVTAIENADASTDDEAEFSLEFTVASFGDTVYLPFGASSTVDLASGVEYSIIDSNTNDVVLTGTAIATLDMDADGEDNSFKVSDEQTFTLVVTYDPSVSGSYKLRLDTVNFAATDVGTATSAQDVSDQNIDTTPISITS